MLSTFIISYLCNKAPNKHLVLICVCMYVYACIYTYIYMYYMYVCILIYMLIQEAKWEKNAIQCFIPRTPQLPGLSQAKASKYNLHPDLPHEWTVSWTIPTVGESQPLAPGAPLPYWKSLTLLVSDEAIGFRLT